MGIRPDSTSACEAAAALLIAIAQNSEQTMIENDGYANRRLPGQIRQPEAYIQATGNPPTAGRSTRCNCYFDSAGSV